MQTCGSINAPRLGRPLRPSAACRPAAARPAAAVVARASAASCGGGGGGGEGAGAGAPVNGSLGTAANAISLNTPFPAPTTPPSSSASSSAPLGQPPAAAAGAGAGGPSGPGASGGGEGGGGGGGGGGGNNGDGNNGDSAGDGDDEVLLDAAQAEAAALSAKIDLPPDMALAARTVGLRSGALARYAALRGLGGAGGAAAGALAARFPAVRDRLLADDRFLFKVAAECAIDSACATVAEVRKRGDHFWGELELYLSDLTVGLVLDVVLVTLMAPAAVIAGRGAGAGAGAGARGGAVAAARAALARVPSAVFAPSLPGGARFTPLSRAACLAVKFLEYSLAGIVCGLLGQAAANGMIAVKRRVQRGQRGQRAEAEAAAAAARGGPKAAEALERRRRRDAEAAARAGATDPLDAPLPPVVGTALVWGIFMGVSANLRYQAVFGVERLVGESAAARRLPALAMAATVAVRFVNNVVGGEQFIDFARYFGVQ